MAVSDRLYFAVDFPFLEEANRLWIWYSLFRPAVPVIVSLISAYSSKVDMADPKQANSANQVQQKNRKVKKRAVAEQTKSKQPGLTSPSTALDSAITANDQATLQRMIQGPDGALGGGSVETQTAWLNDPRLQTVQRQTMLAEIGRIQGNRHLQRAITGVPGPGGTAASNSRQAIGLPAAARAVQRQQPGPTPATTTSSPTTRTQTEAALQKRWGVGKVVQGTIQEQAHELRLMNSQKLQAEPSPPDLEALLNQTGWQTWSPPDGSGIWGWLINVFEDFDRVFGAAPEVREIIFYQTEYRFIPSTRGGPKLEPSDKVLASFAGGTLNIYHAVETKAPNRGLPAGRTAPDAQTQVPAASTEAGFRFTLVHELGHGLLEEVIEDEIIRNRSSTLMDEYSRHVGWFGGLLYDAGVEAVRQAIANGQTPEAKHRISGRWDSGKWQEQPVTHYMTDKPDEDFAEAVAVYITNPNLLQARSPRRYEFIHTRLAAFRAVVQQRLQQKTTSPTKSKSKGK